MEEEEKNETYYATTTVVFLFYLPTPLGALERKSFFSYSRYVRGKCKCNWRERQVPSAREGEDVMLASEPLKGKPAKSIVEKVFFRDGVAENVALFLSDDSNQSSRGVLVELEEAEIDRGNGGIIRHSRWNLAIDRGPAGGKRKEAFPPLHSAIDKTDGRVD